MKRIIIALVLAVVLTLATATVALAASPWVETGGDCPDHMGHSMVEKENLNNGMIKCFHHH